MAEQESANSGVAYVDLATLSSDLLANSGAFIDKVVALLLGFAAIGLLAMAIVNVLKTLLPLRRWFYRHQITRHLRDSETALGDASKAIALVIRYSAENSRAFFDQEIDAIFSGIQRTKNLALSDIFLPNDDYQSLVRVWAGRHANDEVHKFYSWLVAPPAPSKNEINQRIGVISSLIDANCVGLRVVINYRWKMTQQLAAVAVSILLIWALMESGDLLTVLVVGILGGAVAPFAHDTVKMLRGAKTK